MSVWESKTLGDLERESDGTIQTGPFGSQLHMSDYSDVGTPVVMPTNIRDLRVDPTGIARVGGEHVERLARHKLRAGDIVYSRRGDVEKCALITENEEGWLCGTGCLLVRVQGPNLDARFLSYLLSRPETRAWISQHAVGATMPNLNTEILREVPVDVPDVKTQRAIAATLGALDDKIESNQRAIASITDLLDAQSEKFGVELPAVPLGVVAVSVKDTVNPSRLGDEVVNHFSLPAFDSGARPEHVAAATIKSNKLRVPQRAVLLSRLNPRFNRTWWASAGAETWALASTEFLVLTSADDLELAAVWLAVRDPFFREELPKRVTGTSGSHQRVRPDDVLAIEVPDFRSAAAEVKKSTLALLMRVESLRVESDRLTALRNALLPELLSGRMRVPAEGAAA